MGWKGRLYSPLWNANSRLFGHRNLHRRFSFRHCDVEHILAAVWFFRSKQFIEGNNQHILRVPRDGPLAKPRLLHHFVIQMFWKLLHQIVVGSIGGSQNFV